jgi:hypothetical protein
MLSTGQIREWLDSLHRVDSRRIILATLIRLLEEPSEPRTGCGRSPAIHANGGAARNRAKFPPPLSPPCHRFREREAPAVENLLVASFASY